MQYISDIIVCNTDKKKYEKGGTLMPILLKVSFAMKQGKVKIFPQDIQFA